MLLEISPSLLPRGRPEPPVFQDLEAQGRGKPRKDRGHRQGLDARGRIHRRKEAR
jgi:hypothetical protein